MEILNSQFPSYHAELKVQRLGADLRGAILLASPHIHRMCTQKPFCVHLSMHITNMLVGELNYSNKTHP